MSCQKYVLLEICPVKNVSGQKYVLPKICPVKNTSCRTSSEICPVEKLVIGKKLMWEKYEQKNILTYSKAQNYPISRQLKVNQGSML